MPSNEGRRPDRPRAPSAPPRVGAGYRIWRLTPATPFDGWLACRRPISCWVHWDGKRDVWCYGDAEVCPLCKDGWGNKWTSWALAVRSVSRGIWAVQVTRAAAANDQTGLWADGNADLYSRAFEVARVRSGPQGAVRLTVGGYPAHPRHVPLRVDLEDWVRRLYGVGSPVNDQGGAEQLGTAPA